MIGAIILAAWIALNLGLAGGALFVAQRRHGIQVLTAKFLAETATVGALFGYVLYGLQPTLVAIGVGP